MKPLVDSSSVPNPPELGHGPGHQPAATRLPVRLAAALALLGLAWIAVPVAAQTADEQTAYDAIRRTVEAGFSEKAANDLAAFRTRFPSSVLVPEATLLEAKARSDLGQWDTAAGLLREHAGRFGNSEDRALLLLGEVCSRRSDFPGAANAYRRLLRERPDSGSLLEAAFGEAVAFFRAGEFGTSIALLSSPTNAFLVAAAARPGHELAVRGRLLLADSQLRSGQLADASRTLDRLTNGTLRPADVWERQFLRTCLLLTNGLAGDAVSSGSNLVALATSASDSELTARSHSTLAGALLRAGRTSEAFDVLTNNLGVRVPQPWRHDAVLALARWNLDPGRFETAIQVFRALARSSPDTDSESGPASGADGGIANASRLALAELLLQRHFAGDASASTHAPSNEARSLLVGVVSNSPPASVAGRAWYGLGWCDLAAGRPTAAVAAFERATDFLGPSTAKALAFFKLADSLVLVTNHAAALTNYLRVIHDFTGNEEIRTSVRERALYQGALAAFEAGRKDLATDLAGRAVLEFPDGTFRDQTRVLYGQALARLDPPHRARDLLQQLSNRLVDSPALPDLQLAVARSYLRERNWSPALQQLDDWTRAHPNHPGFARAQFERAWAAFKAGDDAKAFGIYTNFLARFPDDPAAPQVQVWVADHLYRSGDFAAAEGNYQLVFQRTNWPVSHLTFEARLMAGRAAFSRQGYKDAKAYFRWLIANGPPSIPNSPVPPDLVARAYFGLGDALLLDSESDDPLADAMTAFVYVIEKFSGSRESLLARGKLANCHLQRAELDPAQAATAYAEASRFYLEILKAPEADVPTRSQAEVGLALAKEKQAARATEAEAIALRKESLDRFLSVFHGGNLRPGEVASPFWLNRAGIEAARLAEALGLREQAAGLYDALAETFPRSATGFRQRAGQLRSRR